MALKTFTYGIMALALLALTAGRVAAQQDSTARDRLFSADSQEEWHMPPTFLSQPIHWTAGYKRSVSPFLRDISPKPPRDTLKNVASKDSVYAKQTAKTTPLGAKKDTLSGVAKGSLLTAIPKTAKPEKPLELLPVASPGASSSALKNLLPVSPVNLQGTSLPTAAAIPLAGNTLPQLPPKASLPPMKPAGSLVPANVGTAQSQVTADAKRLLNVRSALTSQSLTAFKPMNDAIGQNFKSLHNPVFSANFSLENDLQYNPVELIPNGTKFQNVVGVRGTFQFMGIPLNLNISNNQAAFNGQNPIAGASLFKFGFSPTMFSGLLKNQLQQYTQLKNTVFQGFNFTDYVHQTITNQVPSLQGGGAGLKNSAFAGVIDNPEKLQGLLTLSESQLKTKLRGIAEEKNKATPDSTGKLTQLTDAEKQANLKKADSLAQVITTINKQLKAKGLDPEKLILEENYLTGKTPASFNSSEAVLGLVDKKPSNTLQSVFGGVKDLRIGSFGTTLPGASDGEQSKLMNGGSLTIKVGYYPMTFGFGTLNDINSLKDAGFQSSDYNYPKDITYIGADMPRSVFGNVSVAVVSSYSGQPNNVQYAVPTLPGNTVAFTVTKSMNLNELGHLAVDVSKSATLFDNAFLPGSEAILLRKAGASYDLTNSLFQSMSLGFRHNLDIKQLDASDNVYFNYAGLGYQNPANNGYSGSTMKFGGDMKKGFYKNKLVFDLRTDYSSTPLSYVSDDKFKNYQVGLDSRYKVDNNFNLDLKYLASGTSQNTQGTSASVYSSQKIEIDGDRSYKIGNHITTSRLAIADQSFKNSYASAAGSNLLNVIYVQSLLFKTSALTGTLFYNKELTSSQLLGNMLTTDVTYQYQLFKQVQFTSGTTYLSNSGYAKQVGVKQGIQVLASKHYDISASFDYMKNLVTPQYADLYPSYRGELSLKYYFKIN